MKEPLGSDFSENLRLLCSHQKSTSAICREIGINRQQFNKYLNASSVPSPYNVKRICDYFSVEDSDLYLPHDIFIERMRFKSSSNRQSSAYSRRAPLMDAFSDAPSSLRRYMGYYLTYCHSGSWAGHLIVGATHVFEIQGVTCSKSLERIRDPDDGTFYRSNYSGQLALLGNRIFIVEHQGLANDAIIETVLYPALRAKLTLLRGVTFGLSSKQRHPYVSRCVWKFVGTNIDLREFVQEPRLVPIGAREIDPAIRRILGDEPFPNHLLHYDDEPYGLG